jgi:hypothetical protein
MKKRCLNPKAQRYNDYGGRGIELYEPWKTDFDSFADWAKASGYTDELTIDRKDNDGDYSPENCRWIPLSEQNRNTRQSVMVEYNGKIQCLKSWCEELGLKYDPIHGRIKNGWSAERAFTEPLYDENKTFAKQCRENGINPQTARDRIVKLGWSHEDAVSIPTTGRGSQIAKPGGYGSAVCSVCGNTFVKNSGKHYYCNSQCNVAAKRQRAIAKQQELA